MMERGVDMGECRFEMGSVELIWKTLECGDDRWGEVELRVVSELWFRNCRGE